MAKRNYECAVSALNDLQRPLCHEKNVSERLHMTKRDKMLQCLGRLGFAAEDLNRINAIHVAGTQGKGSVCAFSESILRCCGFKTGFLSSPHLMEVRERIRINGKPLGKAQFAAYFWEIHDQLKNTVDVFKGYMPSYPLFLTIMGFAVFLYEKVDAAIVEVGMGGTNDSTNIIPQPAVCVVTSLGFDHTKQLGSTIEEIAGHKGGIFKHGRPALIAPQQYQGALKTLVQKALDVKASSVEMVPCLSCYPDPKPVLGLTGEHQLDNASLAIQACKTWMISTGHWKTTKHATESKVKVVDDEVVMPYAEPFPLTQQFYQGLKECIWPGRNQIIQRNGVTYYLDGAHTPASMHSCAQWFNALTASTREREQSLKILVYNTTRWRDPREYLLPLMMCGFHYAFFCPNISFSGKQPPDTTRVGITEGEQQDWCKANELAFNELLQASTVETRVFHCISEAVKWIEEYAQAAASSQLTSVNVLVTGSLYLVGGTMAVLGVTVDDTPETDIG